MQKISLGLGALILGAAVSAQAADLEKGKQLVEKGTCAACHGAGLNAPISPDYPKLAGQHGDYIYHALLAYQISNNYASVNGRGLPSAPMVAGLLLTWPAMMALLRPISGLLLV